MAFTKQQPSNLKASKEQEHHQERVLGYSIDSNKRKVLLALSECVVCSL